MPINDEGNFTVKDRFAGAINWSALNLKTFEKWRRHLTYLLAISSGSAAFLGYRLTTSWDIHLLVAVIVYLILFLPVVGILFIWWVVTELSSIPDIFKNLTGVANSIVPPMLDVSPDKNQSQTQEKNSRLLLGSIRKVFGVFGVAFDLSDLSGVMAMAMSLANPLILIILVLSFLFSAVLILAALGYAMLWGII